MAGYREHISVSSMLGVGYGLGATFGFGFTPAQGVLAGCLTGIAGMLPDLDSQTGKPVRELFSLLGALAPTLMMPYLWEWGGTIEGAMLLAIGMYAAIRYGGAMVLGKLAVHRGMYHSIPALLIATELTFLCYKTPYISVKILMATGVALGFLSHLVLDECYSVELSGVVLKLNQAAGSAVKLFGKNVFPNLFTYSLLALLTYVSLIDAGLVEKPDKKSVPGFLRQAMESDLIPK